MDSQFPRLLSPIRLGPVEVRNRLVSSAHGTSLSRGHRPTPELVAYHAARARGGIGLIILEAARVHPTSRPAQASLVSWDEQAVPLFHDIAVAVHEHGAKVFAQLLHQGKATNPMDTRLPLWSPSPTPAAALGSANRELTHAMTKGEVQELIQWFVRGALNMKTAGFDGVEVHAGHGYLLHDFMSPLTNHRTDEYGGDLRNRARIVLELVRALRQALGRGLALGIRISADELVPGGLTLRETTQTARWLEETGDLDFLNITHSNTAPMSFAMQQADMAWPQAPFVHLAEGIKRATRGIPVFAVCRIIDPSVAEGIIAAGKADMVCMTRAHIADPEIGRKLMEGRPYDIRQCIGANEGCGGRSHRGKPIGCATNPEAGREHELGPLVRATGLKAIAVVGGGPAGLEAARVAALRGHVVVLYERAGRLGGQVNTLVKAPYRHEFGNIIAWLEYQVKKLGVVVKLNTEATPELLRDEGAEAVIVATGSVPNPPEIPGVEGSQGTPLVSVDDVLEGRVAVGRQAVLLDGDSHHRAASTAEFLADRGAAVHLVTQADSVAGDITFSSRPPVIQRLKEKRVAFHRDNWVRRVMGRTVVLADIYNGEETALEDVDLLVSAVTNRPRTELYDALVQHGGFEAVVAAGDCVSPRRVLDAVREGHMAARGL